MIIYIKLVVFDFDGVFTDNCVYVDQFGNENVKCNRGDGLGLDLLRNYIAKNLLDYGVHSPTIYFPTNVPEAIMIEPTETETKETLEFFACFT